MFQSKIIQAISPYFAEKAPAGEVVLLVLFAHALVQHPGVSHLKPEPSRTKSDQSESGLFEPPEDVTGLPSKPWGNMAALGT